MDCAVLVWLILFNNNISFLLAKSSNARDIERIIEMIQRRHHDASDEAVIDTPRSVEDLPEAEPIRPGHTLLQPTLGMLKSSIKYPRKDVSGTAVYGNLNNLGITFGKTNQRWLYTNFRKSTDLLTYLLERAIRNIQREKHSTQYKRNPSVVLIEIDAAKLNQIKHELTFNKDSEELSDKDYKVSETPNRSNALNEYTKTLPTRRKGHKKKKNSKFRDRGFYSESDSEESSSSGSSDYERNPGNPYTVHKDKYKQNWMWNHFMDGSHMNINPYAPQFNSLGPSGASLFFGRKWWYFNQDDFQPLS